MTVSNVGPQPAAATSIAAAHPHRDNLVGVTLSDCASIMRKLSITFLSGKVDVRLDVRVNLRAFQINASEASVPSTLDRFNALLDAAPKAH